LKYVDKASPKLIGTAAEGAHLQQALVTFRKAGGGGLEYLKYTFHDLLVSSVRPGATAVTRPGEVVTFSFAKAEIEYCTQRPDGSLGDCSVVELDQTRL
jgi:type VI secretion system secreted protein Hcp